MTVEPRTLQTDAEKAIVENFERVVATLPGGADVRARREAAFDTFRRTGLPHRRIEEWKYTDLRALVRKAVPPAPRPSAEAARSALAASPDPLAGLDRYTLVIVDGYYFDALSDVKSLTANGVEVTPIMGGPADEDTSTSAFATPELAVGDIAFALNTAFVTDGVRVRIGAGVLLDKPLEIRHVTTAAQAVTSRHAVLVGPGAAASLLETYTGPADTAYQTNSVMQITTGVAAVVRYARLQAEGDKSVHVGTTTLKLAPKAEFDHLTVTTGALVSRSQMFITTGGDHTRLGLQGAGMIGGKQHADVTLLIDHALPGANTRVLFKNAVDDDARGVFQGKIIVEPDAQKTDAKMMSQALLLSATAEFDSKPELEIFADDVQCGHGSTAGQIDATQLFYLMARGVPRAEAEQLLIEAFLDSAIDALGDERIAAALRRTVSAWLAKRGARAQ
jgi:Fe-S cluster assembly protein SufD